MPVPITPHAAQVAQQQQQAAIAARNAAAAHAAQVAQQQQQATIARNNAIAAQAAQVAQQKQQAAIYQAGLPKGGPPAPTPPDNSYGGPVPSPTGPPAAPAAPMGGPGPGGWAAQGFATGSTGGTPQAANPSLGLWSLMPTQEFQALKASYGGKGSQGWRDLKASKGADWKNFKTQQGGFGAAAKWAAPRLP